MLSLSISPITFGVSLRIEHPVAVQHIAVIRSFDAFENS